ncbi:MAG: hypothetical protein ACP5M4_14620 [Acidobacteriaceae bacterium]
MNRRTFSVSGAGLLLDTLAGCKRHPKQAVQKAFIDPALKYCYAAA